MSNDIDCHINHLGYRQYYSAAGNEICPMCNSPYVNKGAGSVCSKCSDIHELSEAENDELDSH